MTSMDSKPRWIINYGDVPTHLDTFSHIDVMYKAGEHSLDFLYKVPVAQADTLGWEVEDYLLVWRPTKKI